MSDLNLLKEMGERIYKRRKALKLTQEELTEKLGVSTQMISNLELGKKAVRPENLAKLCRELDLSADFILSGYSDISSASPLADKIKRLSPDKLLIIEGIIDYMNKNKSSV